MSAGGAEGDLVRRVAVLLLAVAGLAGCATAHHRPAAQRAIVYEELGKGRPCRGEERCFSDEEQLIFPRGGHDNAVRRAERSLKRPCRSGEVLLVKLPGSGRCVSGREAREWEGAPAVEEKIQRVIDMLERLCPGQATEFTDAGHHKCVKRGSP
jgi:hypothetical protein